MRCPGGAQRRPATRAGGAGHRWECWDLGLGCHCVPGAGWVLGAVFRLLGAFPAAGVERNSRFTLAIDLWREPGALPAPDPASQCSL